mgnify:CR=1 FL=1
MTKIETPQSAFQSAFITRTNTLNNFIIKNIENIVNACKEQANIMASASSLQQGYQTLINNGYGFTVETTVNAKGKEALKRIDSLGNEWTAIKNIAENAELVLEFFEEAYQSSLPIKSKVTTVRGIWNLCKPKPTATTTLEGEGETTEGEATEGEGETTEGKKTPRTMHELLKNITDIVEAEGYEMFKFIDFAISEEGRKITEKETAMSK